MKALILTFISIFALLSCSDSDSSFSSQNVTFTLVGKGELTIPFNNNTNSQNIVIRNQSDWANFLQLLSVSGNSASILVQPSIDFNTSDVICVIDNVRSTGGNSIDITSVVENSNDIEVTIAHLNEGDATVVTQPIHIVQIPKTTKPITFL